MCLAVPGRITTIAERDGTRMAQVDFGGVQRDVCLEYVPAASVGDYVIVHVGFAIQRLDEQSAKQTLALFEDLGLLEEEFGDGFAAAARQAGYPPDGVATAPHNVATAPHNVTTAPYGVTTAPHNEEGVSR